MATSTSAEAVTVHPLDPLTAAEIGEAVAVLRRERALAADVLFIRVALHEPPKDVVLGFRAGDPIDRQAFIVLRDRGARATREAVVSITKQAVVSWQIVPNVQPPITVEEFFACERLVRASPVWHGADPDEVCPGRTPAPRAPAGNRHPYHLNFIDDVSRRGGHTELL